MTDKWWQMRPAHPQDTLLTAGDVPQPFTLASTQWESTGKLPPNTERFVLPRASFNPTFEVGGDAPVPVWTWESLAYSWATQRGCPRCSQSGFREVLERGYMLRSARMHVPFHTVEIHTTGDSWFLDPPLLRSTASLLGLDKRGGSRG